MKRQIRWTDLDPDDVKVRVRVTIHGKQIKWQFQRKGEEVWDYDTPPTDAQWQELERRLQEHYQRGNVAIDKAIKQVQAARAR